MGERLGVLGRQKYLEKFRWLEVEAKTELDGMF